MQTHVKTVMLNDISSSLKNKQKAKDKSVSEKYLIIYRLNMILTFAVYIILANMNEQLLS